MRLLTAKETFQPMTGIAWRLNVAVPTGDAVGIHVPPLCSLSPLPMLILSTSPQIFIVAEVY